HDVTGPGEGGDLARVDVVEPVVVRDGGEGRGIGRQGDDRQRWSILLELAGELRREMRRACSAATIAEDISTLPTGKRVRHQLPRCGDLRAPREKLLRPVR